MSDSISLNTFPKNSAEALAMLFVQSQDLSEMTPETLARVYDEALTKIQAEQKELRLAKRTANAKPANWVY